MASFDDDFEPQPSSAGGFSEFLDEAEVEPAAAVDFAAPSSTDYGRPDSAGFVEESYVQPSSPAPYQQSPGSFRETSSPAVFHETSSPASFQASPSFNAEPLAKYRREHADFIDEKDRKAEETRREFLAKAKAATEEFYKKEAEKRAKHQAKNREEEKKYVAERDAVLDGSYSNDWERVATLIDVKAQPIGRDTSRMRKLLIELKH